MVFKAIKTNRSLRIPPKKSEAYLSDLFFILYFIYLNKDKTRSKINIQKGIVYVLEKLLEKGKLDDIKVFNLPFYRWTFGDYNKYIATGYLPELMGGNLIDEGEQPYNYKTTEKANKFLERFEKENSSNEDLLLIKDIINSYPNENDFWKPFRFSHERKVKVGEQEKSVDSLEKDESIAIAYNSNPEDEDGSKSNIISTSYLLALNSLLEETKIGQPKESDLITSEIISKLFESAGIE
ncbi:MAG: hypothetical protein A2528_03355 [Candidatus Staskawiczbacteria bacterium RIFOXYD2_FULL_37_9]|uniref:Uncharacterized protein n=1 Tax=Candidatus Staskawiczbacteria bacterium RIFOXYB1_FULL_37_44 TaxID=1802223 RepID=A0A1G2IWK8_9BACT|nr:MAG: hypothetical protein A2358_02825 [Candidatus Staskawiczbacteria bacterium RIFOXYB1_FULL_37_44]OGZ83858.1 MAG: hypothetical protein A2416_02540 [Candidatus Staskawiczbacteria bacterium RIFOXYC1_FULL_37_52]OGZ89365.1 MAG: hypothetical protein A2581_00600 [Candidatus Staskawiczbacteria bacterium RIFOXYD1_FULL_37_110]OGZ94507.1 MAG: hypothetical protein A2528_03355 [Candidatus Staskawiczbacteria bacterium RIFOXYD2_FULL_37_9]